MLLRDFLYVDSDKVRGLLAQLDEGVVEASVQKEHGEKLSGAGLKGLAEHSQRWGTETTTQKSLGDALFPTLEAALESLGVIRDISQELTDIEFWGESMQEQHPPGTLIRLTAPAALFDARYVASTMAAFATTFRGMVSLGALEGMLPKPPKKGGQGPQRPKGRRDAAASDSPRLEDTIPDGDIELNGETISRDVLTGIVQISRGMFSPGLHLNMRPTGEDSHVVTARLQEGRQFLDGDAEILFSRYGALSQEWTLVGVIGHYGTSVEGVDDGSGLIDAAGNVNRGGFISFVNNFMSFIGTLGFVDVPPAPGFSVVPIAVYRLIGEPEIAHPTLEEPDRSESRRNRRTTWLARLWKPQPPSQ